MIRRALALAVVAATVPAGVAEAKRKPVLIVTGKSAVGRLAEKRLVSAARVGGAAARRRALEAKPTAKAIRARSRRRLRRQPRHRAQRPVRGRAQRARARRAAAS